MLAKAELNYYPEEILEKPYIERPRKPNRKRKKRARKKPSINILFKFALLFCVGIIMFTSLFILLRYARITELRMNVTKLEREKIELEKTKSNLIGELEDIKSSLKIAEDAAYKLGMSYPEEGQVVYVSIEDKDVAVDDNFSILKQFKKVISLLSTLL